MNIIYNVVTRFQFKLFLAFFTFQFAVYGQTPYKVPKPYYPPLASQPKPSSTAPPSIKSVFNPTASANTTAAEVTANNRFKDLPVNLYLGTPMIGLPLYTLQEAGISVPIGLSYNASGMKAHELAAWSGTNWSLYAGGMISRVVRGLPDEGKLEMTSWTQSVIRTGYFSAWSWTYGNGLSHNDDDKEPDMFYLNLGGQSYKMMFTPSRPVGKQFVFFPETDIKVEPTFNTTGIGIGNFSSWKITMPDGTQYFFGQGNAIERSTEIEAAFAIDNGVNPNFSSKFQHYWNCEAVASAWYLTKIRSAYGHEVIFTYKSSRYSFHRLADTQATEVGPCPNGAPDKKINKVYVAGVVPHTISSRNTRVEFNKDCWSCYTPTDPETGQPTGEEICHLTACTSPRLDIDGWALLPNSSSDAKKLAQMTVYDLIGGSTDTLKYLFDYDYFESDPAYNALPSGYSTDGAGGTTPIGTTHLKRLRLKEVKFPDQIKYQFSYWYQDAPTTFYSRLSFGIDHWGFLNGFAGIPTYGLLAKDLANNCTNLPSRNTDVNYARYGLLKSIEMRNGYNLGTKTELDYEAHQAQNYYDSNANLLPIGGARIKTITTTDQTTARTVSKFYSYLKADGSSSGVLSLQPFYTFKDNLSSSVSYFNSGLYERLLAETNRPVVGYSRVIEEIKEGTLSSGGVSSGYQVFEFNQTTTDLTYSYNLSPQHFHPVHDYLTGNPLSSKVYNAAGQLLSATYSSYTPNNGIKTDSVLAQKLYRSNGITLGGGIGGVAQYYIPFSTYRLESQTAEGYDQNGQNPAIQPVDFIYKDEMPLAYRNAYSGKHQQLVQTSSTDSQGLELKSLTKYTADFDFGADSVFYDQQCEDGNGNSFPCGYWLVTDHVPTGADARAVYELKKANVFTAMVEVAATRNGKTVGASYQSYGSFNIGQPFQYLPKESFVLGNLPKNSFTDVVYSSNELVKDTDFYVTSAIPEYNSIGLPKQIKSLHGPLSKINYDASDALVSSSIANFNQPQAQTSAIEYQSKIFGPSKQIAPNALEINLEYYADSRLKRTLDQDGNVLKHYQYFAQGETDPSGTVNENFIYLYRTLTRSPRIATNNALQGANEVMSSISSFTASGQLHNRRFYRQSPLANTDIVTDWTSFDAFSRPNRVELPLPNDDAAIDADEYTIYGDAAPYQDIRQHEASPLSRVKQTIAPGYVFRQDPNNLKASTANYQTAGPTVRNYVIQANGNIDGSSNFASYQLSKTSSTDERGQTVTVYKDKDGRTIRQDVTAPDGTVLTTAYIYDEVGRLRYILPPKTYNAATVFNETNLPYADFFKDGVYAFRYDGRGRLIAKQVPNGGWTYMVYNRLNQLVMTQNERQRLTSLWEFVLRDGLGRTVATGTKILAGVSHQQLQDNFNNDLSDNQFISFQITTNQAFTNSPFGGWGASDLQTINYYDDYNWQTDSQLNFGLYNHAQYTNAKGLLTGTKVRRLDNGNWLASVLYYNNKNRVIQSRTRNRFGLVNQTDKVYNFISETLEERTIYRRPSKPDLIIKTFYTRDNAGRIIKTTHQLNNDVPVVLANYGYDAIGRLSQKRLNELPDEGIIRQEPLANGQLDLSSKFVELKPGTYTATNGTYCAFITPLKALQIIDYAYNLHGKLRTINSPLTGSTNNENDLFYLKLDYFEDGRFYNGLLSKQTFQTLAPPSGAGGAGDVRSFLYDYDGFNRLKSGAYTGQGAENYTLNNLDYDANGNIQTLQRYGYNGSPIGGGGGWSLIDNLLYNYADASVGNQLTGITDSANPTKGFVQAPSGGLGAYTYYPDGSLKSDANKGITNIDYNYLGLPDHIEFGSTQRIENIYDATGLKLSQKLINGTTVITTDYMGGLIIRNDTLKTLMHDEGCIRFDANEKPTYQFFITDHLGNTRVIVERVSATLGIAQETHYGPYGEVLEGIGQSGDWKFLFQGKEYIDAFGLNMYDFGWRMGDAWSGRWASPDPADQFQNISPYTFMGNNPVSITDPDGRFLPLVYAGAALVGGGVNLWSNWRKVKDWKSGLAYFASGAVGGAVSVTNPMAGGAITAAGNVATDLATGNFPDFKNSKTPLKDGLWYAGGVALDGFGASGAGAISKFVLKGLGFELVKTSVALGGSASPMVATGVGEAVVEEGSEWIVQGVKTPVTEIGAEIVNGVGDAQKLLPAPSTIARHHIFPREFKTFFKKAGININDYTIEMEHFSTHLKGVHGKGLFNMPGKWNLRWEEFINANPNATSGEIFKFGEDLMAEYGFRFSRFVKYR